jgi:hypothetical protein
MGDRRRRTLCTRLSTAAERWVADWVSGPVSVSASIKPTEEAKQTPQGTVIYGVRGARGDRLLIIEVPPGVAAWVAGARISEGVPTGAAGVDSIVAAVTLKLIRGLWSSLARDVATSHGQMERLGEEDQSGRSAALGRHAVRVHLRFDGSQSLELGCLLSTSLAADLLAERRVQSRFEPPGSRRAALSSVRVGLECELGMLQVAVRDLHSLRPGDVLLTDISLSSRAQLRVRGAKPVIAAGLIGENDGRKAIQIDAAYRGKNP